MIDFIDIAGRRIGPNHPCFLIAEAGVNHNGALDTALRLVDAAVASGADAVKFQTFQTEQLVSADAPKAEYQKANGGAGESQFTMLKKLELTQDQFTQVQTYCAAQEILFLSTPFDAASADFLDALGMPAFKISSGEVTNHPFLRHIATKGKPIILSTGMSTLGEVDDAVRVIRNAGNPPLVLLQCVSNYPAAAADTNLRAMRTLSLAFQTPVGYSDHTLGIEVALASVALGACIVEKHFTLDKGMPGPDHAASADPAELKHLVRSIRNVEVALGTGAKQPTADEANTREVARRSLALARDVAAGVVITAEDLTALRPSGGISPALLAQVTGRSAARNLAAGERLQWSDLT